MKMQAILISIVSLLLLSGCLPNDNTLGSVPAQPEQEKNLEPRLFFNYNPITGEGMSTNIFTAGIASFPQVFLAKGDPVNDQWEEIIEPLEIRVESQCAADGLAEISSTRVSEQSKIELYYRPLLSCQNDSLTIYAVDRTDIAPIIQKLVIQDPKAASIAFNGFMKLDGTGYDVDDGKPALLGTKNSLNNLALPESILVRFKILDVNGEEAGAGHKVYFSGTTESSNNSIQEITDLILATEGVSNALGEITASVRSSSFPLRFRIKAQLAEDESTTAYSSLIEINSGTIDIKKLNPVKQEKSDLGFKLTFTTLDSSGRSALLGTNIKLSVNNGAIDPECVSGTPVPGVCQVEWKGGYNPDQADILFDLTASGFDNQGFFLNRSFKAEYTPDGKLSFSE